MLHVKRKAGRQMADREKIEFQPNVPQMLTIEYSPEQREGRFGTQWQYKFQGNRIAWLDEDVHELIQEATGGSAPRSSFSICKRTMRDPGSNRQRAAWEVVADEPPQQQQQRQERQQP